MCEMQDSPLWRLAYKTPVGVKFYLSHCGGSVTLPDLGVLFASEESARAAIPPRATEFGIVWEPEESNGP